MITFRLLNEPLPLGWETDTHWQVEFWPDEMDSSRPDGLAWVTDCGEMGIYLDYILVCDDCRRQGVATALVKAIKERWPQIVLTEAISPEGEAFLAKIES